MLLQLLKQHHCYSAVFWQDWETGAHGKQNSSTRTYRCHYLFFTLAFWNNVSPVNFTVNSRGWMALFFSCHYFPQGTTRGLLKAGDKSRSMKNYRHWKAKTCTLLWPLWQSLLILSWMGLLKQKTEEKKDIGTRLGLTGMHSKIAFQIKCTNVQ